MAFQIRYLEVLAYAPGNAFTLWHYCARHASDPLEAVLADGYFLPADDMLNPGDRVMVQATDGAADLYIASIAPLRLIKISEVLI